jgi:hypothetical protein
MPECLAPEVCVAGVVAIGFCLLHEARVGSRAVPGPQVDLCKVVTRCRRFCNLPVHVVGGILIALGSARDRGVKKPAGRDWIITVFSCRDSEGTLFPHK